MPAENTASVYSTPAMSAEAETEMLLQPRPVRVSGFFALILGLLSFVALFGAALIIVPVLAAIAALIALRPYSGERPVGFTPAVIGLFLAVLFGVWGTTQRHMRHQVLSEQAVQFAADWLDLIAQGDLELAVELQVEPSRRQAASMALKEYYSGSEEGRTAMTQFREIEPVEDLIRAGQQVRWELAEPPRLYNAYNRELVRTLWNDQSRTVSPTVQITLEYQPPSGSRPAQWKVDNIEAMGDLE